MPVWPSNSKLVPPVDLGVNNIQTILESINRSIDDTNQILLALTEVIAGEADRERGWPNCAKIIETVKAKFANRQTKVKPPRRKFNHD